MPGTPADDFLALVYKSGVVQRPLLVRYVHKRQVTETLPSEPKKLALQMIRDGLLTYFQAEQLLMGKWRGFVLGGKYKLLERLGSGSKGNIFLCDHIRMNRRVAVKMLPAVRAKEVTSRERFFREARAVGILNHPNIVRAYDLDQDQDRHLLVMEYVEGSSLQDIVTRHGPLACARAAHYIAQAAAGLQHAHEAGLVHRDITPANLLVDRHGVVKILDMGLVRFLHDTKDNLTRQHDASKVLGTVEYLAPEQAIDSHEVDIRADIYSLGITFWFLLTGTTPFNQGDAVQRILIYPPKPARPVRELRPEAPAEWQEIIDCMIARDAADRYQTPEEVCAALSPWLAVPIAPPPAREMPRLSAAARRAGSAEPKQEVAATAVQPANPATGGGAVKQPSQTGPRSVPLPVETPAIAATLTPQASPHTPAGEEGSQPPTVHELNLADTDRRPPTEILAADEATEESPATTPKPAATGAQPLDAGPSTTSPRSWRQPGWLLVGLGILAFLLSFATSVWLIGHLLASK